MLVEHLEVAHWNKARLLFGHQLAVRLVCFQAEGRALGSCCLHDLAQAVVGSISFYHHSSRACARQRALRGAVDSAWERQSCQLPAVQS